MDTETIREIVSQVIDHKITQNWVFYMLIAIFSGAVGFFGAYLKAKALNLATHEDFEKILEQQKELTEEMASIKNKIEHVNWLKKEQNINKRDMLLKVNHLIFNLIPYYNELYKNQILENSKEPLNPFSSPFTEAAFIANLYLEEIDPYMHKLTSLTSELFTHIKDTKKHIRTEIEKDNTRNKLEIIGEDNIRKFDKLTAKLVRSKGSRLTDHFSIPSINILACTI